MATETASECKIIVKKPVLLRVGNLASEFRSGVSVVDIILPGTNAVQVGKLTFKNSYTASITVNLKVLDHAGVEEWKCLMKNYTLMPHPHLETGSQDFFVINVNKTDEPPPQVIMMRLILRQPSPHWNSFGVEEIKCFLHSPMNYSSIPEWLHNNYSRNPGGIKAVQNVSNSESVASNIQQLWALTQEMKSSKQNLSIGRFDELSLRQLKRILARRGLKRRQNVSDLRTVIVAIEQEQRGSGRDIGYRSVWQRLVTDRGLVVPKETVRHALRIIDPAGVDRRLRHRLQRRQYKGRGPNFLWHIDGYDKLKPFGFSIHRCIDGYSWRIMWLEVGMSNNDPTVVARHFVKCIIEMGGTARIVRADCGTENSHVAAIQRFLRNNSDDSFRAEKSFIYGRSVSNQRIVDHEWTIFNK